ncbi:MAG: hypothetical protein ABIR30_14695 [Chitinophagaceae bacterium]
MNAQINQLVRSLLQKETIEQCSLQELEQFADRHPYFGAAQLLLTKKLQTESPERYDEQLQKTFLFFHNPLWVEHLLNDTGNGSVIATEKKEEPPIVSPEIIEPEALVSAAVSQQPVIQEPLSEPVIGQAVTEQITVAPPEEEELVSMPNEPVLKIPEFKTESLKVGSTDLLFEPYHTVDYFASQGIKYKEEEKPVDKFGQQLKSFTDWLKVMRRLPVTEIAKEVEIKAEEKVEQLAEHSLEEGEIVTETMAEVWEKQGNVAKAIEVYSKLSLLYPSKSLYFAAKIEALKKIN